MNYCIPFQQATERCECYNYYDDFSVPKTAAVCEIGQLCVPTGRNPLLTGVKCINVCARNQRGPCACQLGDKEIVEATDAQVCMLSNQAGDSLYPVPMAEFNQLLQRKSVCFATSGGVSQWQPCAAGQMCGKASDGTSKCSEACPADSLAPAACFCLAPDASSTYTQQGKLCSADGRVSAFSASACPVNSFGNGKCVCAAGEDPCDAQSVCVVVDGAKKCVLGCLRNYDNTANGMCACRGAWSTEIIPKGGKCVLRNDGYAAPAELAVCARGQIGPCACRESNLQVPTGDPALYHYTNATSACVYRADLAQSQPLPLLKLGSVATAELPCQDAVSGAVSASVCAHGQYCIAVDAQRVACLDVCAPNVAALEMCACARPGGDTAILAKKSDFCRPDGKVDKINGGICYQNAISPGNCKCNQLSYFMCPQGQFCVDKVDQKQCQPTCALGNSPAATNCVCPFSQSQQLVPQGLVCACANNNINTYQCATLAPCYEDQIGPCACRRTDTGALYTATNAAQACITTGSVREPVMLCKTNVIANQPCACPDVRKQGQTATNAIYINYNAACATKPDGTTEIVLECEQNTVLSAACACRVHADTGSALYCERGNKCTQNPTNPAQFACMRQCSSAKPCPNGYQCVQTTGEAYCEFSCARGCVRCPETPELCIECAEEYSFRGQKCVAKLTWPAITGIVIGVLCFVALVAAVIWLLIRRNQPAKPTRYLLE